MRRKAFTLIELIIAIAIIGILAAVASLSYAVVQKRGRDSQRKNDLAQMKVALSTYYTAQTPVQYVSSATQVTINGSSDTLSAALTPNYMKTVPVDPVNTGINVYKYQSFNTGADFKLFATLENKNDTSGWISGAWAQDGYILQNSI